ncbi:tetratricopeptide repeat protein [Sphingosinicellaceae bacterium]|nr:tetratricopeptide repeat protein [Sphingosinicellaceae bacterium]
MTTNSPARLSTPARLRLGAMVGFVLADVAVAHAHGSGRLPKLDVMAGVRVAAASTPVPEGDAYAMGKSLLALNDVSGALAQFRQAIIAMPNSADALNGVAVSYDRLGRPDIARVYYEAGLALEPDSPTLLNNFGYSLYLQGNLVAAIEPLRAAASSQDAGSAASAQHTLALIAVALRAARTEAPTVAEAPPSAHIEVTTAGEQRLVLDDGPRQRGASPEAHEVMVAAAWTDADDHALLTQVVAEKRAEATPLAEATELAKATALAAAEPAADAVAPLAVPMLASAPAAAARLPSGSRFDVAEAFARARMRAPLGAEATRVVALNQRRLGAGDVGGSTLAAFATGGRVARAEFDSDDAQLNAFATRMRADSRGVVA